MNNLSEETTYLSLLRGINAGRNNRIKMDDLKALFAGGCQLFRDSAFLLKFAGYSLRLIEDIKDALN